MCRALTVLCAAPGAERLRELKRATVAAHWELVGGATSVDELVGQVRDFAPHVVVIEALPSDAAPRVREASATVRIVLVDDGDHEGLLDGRVVRATAGEIRKAILSLPSPGGPVRT